MKNIIKKIALISVLFTVFMQFAVASESFVIREIKVVGLQGVSYGTVINYLPIRVGDRLTSENTGELIRDLYNTGFFQNVELSRQGNTLVIHVVERPTLSSIAVDGNKDIKKEKLSEILKSQGLVQGQVFDNSSLERVTQELKQEYNSLGKYNTHIDTKVRELPRNRVSVTITVSEGSAAKIKEIKIIGNKVFSTATLLRQFELTTPGLFTFFTKKDQYSKEKLEASLEALRSYYMDRGYIRFQVDSTQVSMTPDKKHMYITVKVTEGNRYTLKGYDFAGNLILSKAQLNDIVKLKAGAVFSRKEMADAVQAIGEALGNLGYGFPDIAVNPDINDAERKVFVHFTIQPGRQI
ncbi:MAG: outer membrane protein assembly factor BamA, partial [Proteobacteria bacterium]|nr:outer membrane protein assembly factor BamA [Pseudomonadota bacterium]